MTDDCAYLCIYTETIMILERFQKDFFQILEMLLHLAMQILGLKLDS